MQLEIIAIILSVFSTIVASVDIYLNQFRKGRVLVPPMRAYRLEPLNFHTDDDSYRAVRMTVPLTFVNTGALSQVVDNLRVRLSVPDAHDVFLQWRNECDSIEQESHLSKFATQPTLAPYDSMSTIYSFVSPFVPADGKAIMKLEQYGTERPEESVSARLEMLKDGQWVELRAFRVHHSGRNVVETDFDRINR